MNSTFRTDTEKIAFVASTLPVPFLKDKLRELNISEIVVASKAHLGSYNYLKKYEPDVKISLAPNTMRRNIWYLFLKVFSIKATGKEIIFFHECCYPILDLLIHFIRPNGYFYPQVTLDSFDRFMVEDLPEMFYGKKRRAVKRWMVKKYFSIYGTYGNLGTPGNKSGFDYIFAFKQYPPTIQTLPVGYVNNAKTIRENRESDFQNSKQILLITGIESINNDVIRQCYSEIIQACHRHGYEVHVKDHPNPNFRINLSDEGLKIIDPEMPVELLDDNYRFVVGTASAGMVVFGSRAISILDCLTMMPDLDRRKEHLISLSEQVNFVSSIEEFESWLLNIKSMSGNE